jgi:hypothetical protein
MPQPPLCPPPQAEVAAFWASTGGGSKEEEGPQEGTMHAPAAGSGLAEGAEGGSAASAGC